MQPTWGLKAAGLPIDIRNRYPDARKCALAQTTPVDPLLSGEAGAAMRVVTSPGFRVLRRSATFRSRNNCAL
jgi:hypothetical protein